jgi:uncharacterized protein (DUF488 family)
MQSPLFEASEDPYPPPPGGKTVYTVGHGARPAAELVATLSAAGVGTVVDVRRYPTSRRNPQFNQGALAAALAEAGIAYRHAVELGGRLSNEPGEERFGCIAVAGFRSYVARMGTERWQAALAEAVAADRPCVMCAETPWHRCHRRWIAELLTARGVRVRHLVSPHRVEPHRLFAESDVRGGRLYVCGELVA